jgi:hypothetical protein
MPSQKNPVIINFLESRKIIYHFRQKADERQKSDESPAEDVVPESVETSAVDSSPKQSISAN